MPVFSSTAAKTRQPLQVQTIIDQPITPLSVGRISCVATGLEPILFRWKGPHGKQMQLDATGSEAYGLSPGRYAIRVEAADGSTADVVADVVAHLSGAVAVNEYACTPASSGVAFDGSVRAIGHGLEQWHRYLWSNGVETTEPLLRDARPGWYSLTPLPVEQDVPPFVQYCAPGRVPVARITSL